MLMLLDDVLLQIFFSLFPVIAFYFGYRDGKETNRTHAAIFASCLLSMACCMYFGVHYRQFFVLDMRIIPFLIGLLYGGRCGALLLTAAFFALRYALLGGSAYIAFLLPNLVLIPFALFYARKYRQANLRSKLLAMGVILAVAAVLSIVRAALQFFLQPDAFTAEAVLTIALFILSSLASGGAVIFFIESIVEKQKLIYSLQRLSDAVPSSVISVNRVGLITSVNRTFLNEYRQFDGKAIIGKHFRVITDQYGVDYRETELYRALTGEEMRDAIVDYPAHSLLINAYPLLSPATGDIEGAISISRNITEMRELRDKIDGLDRIHLVGQMAASVAHEIRNPMTSIRGFVQLMSEKDRDSANPHHGYYPIILEELDRVNGIIEDFLSLSRNRVVQKEPGNLNVLVEESLPLLWAEANMNGIEIKLEADRLPELPFDRKEIKQLLLNLTRNAIEAMDKGGTLTLRTEAADDAVHLLVSDTGCGMSSETIEKLFQPFFTTKPKGTGLGLTACKNIVDRHNGRLHVRSAAGQGTTFSVVLPLS